MCQWLKTFAMLSITVEEWPTTCQYMEVTCCHACKSSCVVVPDWVVYAQKRCALSLTKTLQACCPMIALHQTQQSKLKHSLREYNLAIIIFPSGRLCIWWFIHNCLIIPSKEVIQIPWMHDMITLTSLPVWMRICVTFPWQNHKSYWNSYAPPHGPKHPSAEW